MPKRALLFLFSGFFIFVHAGWIKTYGEHVAVYGLWVERTSDSGYIIAGADNDTTHNLFTSKPFGASLILVKTDSLGDTLWTKLYKDSQNSLFAWGRCIQKTADGEYIATGSGGGLWLLRLDDQGDTLWTKMVKQEYQSADGYCVRCLEDGYVVSGQMQYEELTFYIIRFDTTGDTLWSRSYGRGFGTTIGFSIQPAADGGFIVTGSGPEKGLWILRTDSLGDTLWTKLYKLGDPLTYDEGHSIEPTSDGGWIITGAVDYSPAEYGAIALMKIDSLGDTLWTKYYDYSAADEDGKSVKQTPDGGFIVVATKGYSMLGKGSIWLLKTDSAGDTLWTRTYGGKLQDRGDCIQLTPDGGFIITGFTESFSPDGSKQVLLMKLDSLGLLGIAEPVTPVAPVLPLLEIDKSLGREVTLRYSNFPHGFHACIYDASGRRVDELHSSQTHGTIQWGGGRGCYGCYGCYGPGVYFIVADRGSRQVEKVVLVK